MGSPVAVISLALLLSFGVESFKTSEKDYENFEKMLEFGAQFFLNSLDKVGEVTEKLVNDNILKTNRIAIEDHWNAFKETASRISTEERGQHEQDDFVVAARTLRRLLLFYKDDLESIFRSLAVEKGIQQYLPAVNLLEGVIKKEELNDLWGAMESLYLPGAPPIKNDPLEFFGYLLSTNTAETFIVDILKNGANMISQIKSMDFTARKKEEL